MRQKYCLFTVFLFLSLSLSAQRVQRIPVEETPEEMEDYKVEVQINPIALIFGGFQAEAEAKVKRNFGIGVNVIAAPDLLTIVGRTKYYFKPKRGIDRFYIGAQAGVYTYDDTATGIGFDAGYKFVSKDKVIIDLSFGIVRSNDEVWPIGSFGVGYRF